MTPRPSHRDALTKAAGGLWQAAEVLDDLRYVDGAIEGAAAVRRALEIVLPILRACEDTTITEAGSGESR